VIPFRTILDIEHSSTFVDEVFDSTSSHRERKAQSLHAIHAAHIWISRLEAPNLDRARPLQRRDFVWPSDSNSHPAFRAALCLKDEVGAGNFDSEEPATQGRSSRAGHSGPHNDHAFNGGAQAPSAATLS